MHNLYVNYVRSYGRPAAMDERRGGEPAVVPNQIPTVEIKETLAAFNSLPQDQREALLLVVVEGLSYREAAKVLKIPLGTVLSRVSRARQALQGGGSIQPRYH